MPSLKDVLESTLVEAEFDLGKREMTRHGPRTTWRGQPDEIVSAAELHRLAKADSWEDELSLQARGAKVVAPDDALSRLHGYVEDVLSEYIDPENGRIGHSFPMGSANHGGTRIKEGSVTSQIYASLTAEFAGLLVRGCATIVTSNLPFQEWTSVFANERLTGALLDRITHHVHILEMNADSYRLKQSRSRRQPPSEYSRLPSRWSWAERSMAITAHCDRATLALTIYPGERSAGLLSATQDCGRAAATSAPGTTAFLDCSPPISTMGPERRPSRRRRFREGRWRPRCLSAAYGRRQYRHRRERRQYRCQRHVRNWRLGASCRDGRPQGSVGGMSRRRRGHGGTGLAAATQPPRARPRGSAAAQASASRTDE